MMGEHQSRPAQRSGAGKRSVKIGAWIVALFPLAWMLFQVATGGSGPKPLIWLIYWSGLWATALLVATLIVTPIARIFSWPRLISGRRILGVAGLSYTLGHAVVWAALLNYSSAALLKDLERPTLIIATLATVGFVALGLTSFDAAIRAMGGSRWKLLHNTNHVLTPMAVFHFLLSPGVFMPQFMFVGLYLWNLGLRWLMRRNPSPARLALLAAAAALTSAGLEALWIRVYHPQYDAMMILQDNVTFAVGLTAAHFVFLIGLSAAVLGFLRGRMSRGLSADAV